MTLPVGGRPAPPLATLTESLTDAPGETFPAGALLLDVAGSRQDLRATGPAKSFSVAVNAPDVRVCGRNELKQPTNGMPKRSTPPSMKLFAVTTVVLGAAS